MMNITNVDDKIIKSTYLEEYPDLDSDKFPHNLTENMYLPTEKFEAYANRWEDDFFDVLRKMNIQPPDILSRVTEYIDEILEFVEEIERNGYTFVDDGSVYFYGTKYAKDTKEAEMDEDIESLSKDPLSKHNFVLLKKARAYEPAWSSKWGRIRPGWHIECSAMASSIFGDTIDIHGGGIDLAFPHHHNEVLQSNARFYPKSSETWVKHFMHTGHLNISGRKMSRALKNFVTIDQALTDNSPDELRMLFLLHQWDTSMDYSDDTMKDAVYMVGYFNNFVKQVKSIKLRRSTSLQKHRDQDTKVLKNIVNTRKLVDSALRDNMDTPKVISTLKNLASQILSATEISNRLVDMAYEYIVDILSMFGLTMFQANTGSGKDEALVKIIYDIRTELRVIATKVSKSGDGKTAADLYKMTDDIRDNKLTLLGIDLTDK